MKSFDIYTVVYWLPFAFLFLPISISFYRFSQRTQELKALSLILYLILFFDGVARILAHWGMSNLFIWHIYTPIEFYFYSFIFSKHIVPPLPKPFFRGVLYAFGVIALLNVLFAQGFAQVNSYTRVLESMIFVCFSVLLLFQLFRQEESVPLQNKPLFWFACGILLYFSGNLFVFIFSNFLHQYYYLYLNKYVWAFYALMNVITYLLFAIALWKDGRREL